VLLIPPSLLFYSTRITQERKQSEVGSSLGILRRPRFLGLTLLFFRYPITFSTSQRVLVLT